MTNAQALARIVWARCLALEIPREHLMSVIDACVTAITVIAFEMEPDGEFEGDIEMVLLAAAARDADMA